MPLRLLAVAVASLPVVAVANPIASPVQRSVVAELRYDAADDAVRAVPEVSILSDGWVVIAFRGQRATTRMTAARLRALCPTVFADAASLTQAALDREIAEFGRQTGLVSLPDSAICELFLVVETAGPRRVRCQGAPILARRFGGDAVATQEFEQCRRELERLRDVVVLGGEHSALSFAAYATPRGNAEQTLLSLCFAERFGQTMTAHFDLDGQLLIVSRRHGRFVVETLAATR